MRAYASWKQVAGYFDGDGNVSISDLSNQPYKLSLSLIFTDASLEQITMIRNFFALRSVRTSKVLRTSKGTAWMVAISRRREVLLVMKKMLPYLYKKANEAESVIDYYEGRITGNDLAASFAREVEAGRRERRTRKVPIDVPFNIVDGEALMSEARGRRLRDSFGRFRAKVNPGDYIRIREGHFNQGITLRDLMLRYPSYSKETIRRILGRDRGYVGVIGIGRVDTTDTTLREPKKAHPETDR